MVRMYYWLSILQDAVPYLVQVQESQGSTENEILLSAAGYLDYGNLEFWCPI